LKLDQFGQSVDQGSRVHKNNSRYFLQFEKVTVNMAIFAPSVVNLWRAIESYGLDPEALFAKEDIKVRLPIDPCVRLPYEKIDRIRAAAAEQSGDEAFGLRAATVYLPSQFGALGYAWHASLTLRKACQRLERFIRILSDKASVKLKEADDCLVVSLNLDADSANDFARDDAALAQLTGMCRSVVGDKFRLQAVHFKHSEPRDIKPYFEYFGCPLSFAQPNNQLLIPLSLVDETLAGANAELARVNDQVVTRRLAKMDQSDIVTRVQVVLTDQLPVGGVSDESVAEALHMSVRTMHRKLTEVNQNFRGLLVELRRNLAEQYIMDNSLTLTEISLLLGFSEPSSFSRAFKNWTGTTPSDVRRSYD
jgi:AraC-like DNA-binding protein